MADTSLQEHRSLIIRLFKQQYAEEEIVDELCRSGVETTFPEILQCLEMWHVIPCPSPVYSNDTDTENASDQPPKTSPLKLGVTCHHGESSHSSTISTAGIACDAKPAERYRQNRQSHEELALGLLISDGGRARRIELAVDDSTINGMSGADTEFENEVLQDIKKYRQCNTRRRKGSFSERSPGRILLRHRRRAERVNKKSKAPITSLDKR